MAINISMTTTFRFTNPQVLANPANYFLDLSQAGMTLPTESNQITADVTTGSRLGGPSFIRVRPDESFSMTDQQFGTLVKASQAGYIGPTDFMNNLLNLINRNILQVDQDGTILTPEEIFNFTP